MFSSNGGRRQKMLLVGVWANRNWILGNWIKEVKARSPQTFRVRWVPTIFAGKRRLEKFAYVPFPTYGSYFFSYITIFEMYLSRNFSKYVEKSIVLYPHNETEMGSLDHQAQILNHAQSVYFFCSHDAESLAAHGLLQDKIRFAYCAIDVDCFATNAKKRKPKTIVLASKFGPRKGLTILPEIVEMLPDWNFVALGRGWDEFILNSKLHKLPNFSFVVFNKNTRNEIFSESEIFLSLSSLEGGPVPLIEAAQLGCKVVTTDTGFARDLFEDKKHGMIISKHPTVEEVVTAIKAVGQIEYVSNETVSLLTWDRIASLTLSDHSKIVTKFETNDTNKRGAK